MSYTILLVDDVKINRLIMQNILDKMEEEYDFMEASNGEEAKEILKSFSVDLIISDLMMPKMDGFSLIKWIKKQNHLKWLPIIVYTASQDLASVQTCLKLGVLDYFFKPLSKSEVQVIIPLKVKETIKRYQKHKQIEALCEVEKTLIDALIDTRFSEESGKDFGFFLKCFYNRETGIYWIVLFNQDPLACPPALALFFLTQIKQETLKSQDIKEIQVSCKETLKKVGPLYLDGLFEYHILKIQDDFLYGEISDHFQVYIKRENKDKLECLQKKMFYPLSLEDVERLVFLWDSGENNMHLNREKCYKYTFFKHEKALEISLVNKIQEM